MSSTIPRIETRYWRRLAVIAQLVLSVPLLLCAQDHQTAHWGYDGDQGPSHWADLNPEFAICGSGHHQSPIDIRNPRKADLPPLQFDYQPSPLRIIDNGHTVMINYAPGSFLQVGNKRFMLKQFHFHRPSEEKIDGKEYELSLHLVHADEQGNLAVVAVLLKRGSDNALIDELWSDLPQQKEHEEQFNNVRINAKALLPAELGYYTFPGSLTTPPCTENVTWFVLEKPVTVSGAEIQRFEKLYRHNSRPTEPLFDRVVLESK
jgi:carbonic anhydrase